MAYAARVFVALSLILFVVGTSVVNPVGNSNKDKFTVIVSCYNFQLNYVCCKRWLKSIFSKSYRKNARSMAGKMTTSGSEMAMNLRFLLLLSGDVEANPGPTTPGHSTAKVSQTDDKLSRVIDVLNRLETGQASMMENQGKILTRLTTIEAEMEKIKIEAEDMKEKQIILTEDITHMKKGIDGNFNNGKDLQFLMDRHEQYSRKNSIRVHNLKEEANEVVEDLIIQAMKEEIGVAIEARDIDIVHRVGRRQENKPRAILVKFMSHKSKEQVMKKKKEATSLKIWEDLAPGIKRIYDELSINRRLLNLECVDYRQENKIPIRR